MRAEIHLASSENQGITINSEKNMSAVAECLRSWRRVDASATSVSWTATKTVLQTEADTRWTRDICNVITLEEALKELPEHLQETLYRYVYNGETQWEIGQRMGITQQAVHYNLMLTIEELAKIIE